jgi:hypothetical protein
MNIAMQENTVKILPCCCSLEYILANFSSRKPYWKGASGRYFFQTPST